MDRLRAFYDPRMNGSQHAAIDLLTGNEDQNGKMVARRFAARQSDKNLGRLYSDEYFPLGNPYSPNAASAGNTRNEATRAFHLFSFRNHMKTAFLLLEASARLPGDPGRRAGALPAPG